MPILNFNLKLVAKALFESVKDNPFQLKDGKQIARFDEIRVENRRVVFRWRGQDVWYMDTELETVLESSLTISGITGETEFTISCS